MTKLCSNCQLKPPKLAGLCRACHKYQWEHYGEPRPERLWYGPPKSRKGAICQNCKGGPVYANGLCVACNAYQKKKGQPRPKRLWGKARKPEEKPRKQKRTCQCGKEAERFVTLSIFASNRETRYKEPLCAECAAIEEEFNHVHA